MEADQLVVGVKRIEWREIDGRQETETRQIGNLRALDALARIPEAGYPGALRRRVERNGRKQKGRNGGAHHRAVWSLASGR
jgi:hypothetical protein